MTTSPQTPRGGPVSLHALDDFEVLDVLAAANGRGDSTTAGWCCDELVYRHEEVIREAVGRLCRERSRWMIDSALKELVHENVRPRAGELAAEARRKRYRDLRGYLQRGVYGKVRRAKEEAGGPATTADGQRGRDVLAAVREAWDRLEDVQRAVLIEALDGDEGEPLKSVAENLGESYAAWRQRLGRARRALLYQMARRAVQGVELPDGARRALHEERDVKRALRDHKEIRDAVYEMYGVWLDAWSKGVC